MKCGRRFGRGYMAAVDDSATTPSSTSSAGSGDAASAPVSLVIPVRNQIMHTMQGLESLQRMKKLPYEIIVVDNASTDGTPPYLKTLPVRVITNWTNVGQARAWGLLNPCMLIGEPVFDRIGVFDEAFNSGRCARIDFLWRARKARIGIAVTGSAFIHHFAGKDRDFDRSAASANGNQNLDHFR